MRFYLAGRYIRREELAGYAEALRRLGHDVTSRWLLGDHQWDGAAAEIARAYEEGLAPPEAVGFARDDVEDLIAAEAVISFTEEPRKAVAPGDVKRALEEFGERVPKRDRGGPGFAVWSGGHGFMADYLSRAAGASSRGGRHVEFGMALALHKILIVVGPRENVFHLVPAVHHFDTWSHALRAIAATVPVDWVTQEAV